MRWRGEAAAKRVRVMALSWARAPGRSFPGREENREKAGLALVVRTMRSARSRCYDAFRKARCTVLLATRPGMAATIPGALLFAEFCSRMVFGSRIVAERLLTSQPLLTEAVRALGQYVSICREHEGISARIFVANEQLLTVGRFEIEHKA